MRIGIYVPCYNGASTLRPVLEAILAQQCPADEILVIDDGSTDASREIAASLEADGVRLVRQATNRGLGAARNRALHEAKSEVLIGVDADVEIERDYTAGVVSCLTKHRHVGALCGRLSERNPVTTADRWRSVHMSQDTGPESRDNPRFLFGCTTSIRRDVALKIGGWDERFTHTHEDVDLTERLRRAGISFRSEARCRAWHLKRDTPESVLTGFWRWYLPAGVLRGEFDSVQGWMDRRIGPVCWGLFQDRFAKDLEAGREGLLWLTVLLPWWLIRRDLDELRRRDANHGCVVDDVAAVLPDITTDVLVQKGLDAAVAESLSRRLADGRIDGASDWRPDAAPLAAAVVERIRVSAERTLSDAPWVWDRVAESYRRWDGQGAGAPDGAACV